MLNYCFIKTVLLILLIVKKRYLIPQNTFIVRLVNKKEDTIKKNLFVSYQILLFIRFIASSYTFFPFCLSPLKHSLDIFSITSSGGIFSWFIVISFFSSAESKSVKLDGSIDKRPVALIRSEI